jgi:carbonic anhydrase/acetyltransferase-like protein (isoleucine patch superfamily)
MSILSYNGHLPRIEPNVFLANGSTVAGDVTLKEGVNVWFGAVLRGDMAAIFVDCDTNIQDGAIVHVNTDVPTHIGKRVTVGHGAIIHGATVGDDCMIGMGSILLDRSIVEDGAMVAAGTIVPPGKVVPKGMLAMGSPMKIVRPVTPEEALHNQNNAAVYRTLAKGYDSDAK